MTDTSPRDLIRRLVDEFEGWIVHAEIEDIERAHGLIGEARDYLAHPEPKEPTDDELMDLAVIVFDHPLSTDKDYARAVLACWGK